MKLQQQIKQDLTAAMKAKDEKKKNALRVMLGEFSRLDKKELGDDDVVKILKKLIKAEKEIIQKKVRGRIMSLLKLWKTIYPKWQQKRK